MRGAGTADSPKRPPRSLAAMGPMGQAWRAAAVAGLVGTLLALVPAHPAAADGDLQVDADTTYRIDPAAGVVHVESDIALTNLKPPIDSGDAVTSYFYSAFGAPVPDSATNVAATDGGNPLGVSTQPLEPATRALAIEVDLGGNLGFQETQHIILSYDLVGKPPRSDDPSRVNPSYVAFPVWPIGDPGRASVAVVTPPDFTIDTVGEDLAGASENGSMVYRATAIPNPD